MLKKFRSVTQVCLALLLSLFSSNIMSTSVQAYSLTNPNNDFKKVYVCKYVGTPGVDERLQSGGNPISVSTNALSGFTGLSSFFNDSQGRSVAIAWDNGDKIEPPLSMCPAAQGPTVITMPSVPVDDPCGLQNAVYGTVPAGNYTHAVNPSGSITFTANLGFIFTGNLTEVTLLAPADSNVACPVDPTVIPVPNVPVDDPCGLQNAVYGTVPAGDYTVQLNQNGSITLTANAGFVFTGNLLSVTLAAPTDSNVTCPVDICPNINDLQLIVPQGMEINDASNCVDKKIDICHRTNAVVNPYNKINISTNAADGIADNAQGNQPDHFGEHTGPIFNPAIHENGDDWGDIIPLIEGAHSGLNWIELGQSIYRNNCNMPDDNEGEGEPELSFDYGKVCTDDDAADGEASVEIDNDGNAAANDLTVNLYDTDNNLIATETADIPADSDIEVIFESLAKGTYTIRVFDGQTLLDSGEVEVDECGGHVLDDTATTTRSQVLPATLPATGGETNPLALALAMITAYGAVYFLQGRRQLTNSRES